MQKIFSLPDYPCTEKEGFHDQGFLFCQCGHGRLQNVIPGYGGLVSGHSDSAKHSLDFFAAFVRKHSQRKFVIDIGGNDGYLAGLLGTESILVDPQAAHGLRTTIEDADLSPWKRDQKIIVSSHTLEHIEDPHVFMRKVSECMNNEDTLAIQVPSLELLVEDGRMDHIHHQHIHYFSERSLSKLLSQYGLKVIASEFNPQHWGALMVVCVKGEGSAQGKEVWDTQVLNARIAFRLEMAACEMKLKRRSFVAYGASSMLPVLSYYLPSVEKAEYIADDSVAGIWRNKTITAEYDFAGRDVLITGISSKFTARKLVQKAMSGGAKNVIVPVHQL